MSESSSRKKRKDEKAEKKIEEAALATPLRRMGRVEVVEGIIADHEVAFEIFFQMGFVPWDVHYDGKKGCFMMLGTSPLFREKTIEEPAPFYDVHVDQKTDEEGYMNITVSVVEQKPSPRPILLKPGRA